MKFEADIKINEKIEHCKILEVGYNDDGYTSKPTAVALIHGELKEYPTTFFYNISDSYATEEK